MHPGGIEGVGFSSDGRQLVTVGRTYDLGIRLWDVQTATLARTLRVETEALGYLTPWSVSASPDGKRLAVAATSIEVFDLATGQRELGFAGSADMGSAVSFSPDGKLLAAGTFGLPGNAGVWDLATQREIFRQDKSGNSGIFLTADGRLIACGDGEIYAWNIHAGEELFQLPSQGNDPEPVPIALRADGTVLAEARAGSAIRLYNAKTGVQLDTLDAHERTLQRLCFSPDGRLLAALDDAGTIMLWEPATKGVLKTWKIGYGVRPVRNLAFSPDGRYLATANANGTAYLLEVGEARRQK